MDFKYIDKIQWYRQGGAINLFFAFFPYHGINETIGYDRNIIYQLGDMNTAFFDRKRETEKFKQAIKAQARDKHFIDRWIKDWEKRNKSVIDYCNLHFAEPVEKWSDKKLVNFLKKYSKLALHLWIKGVFLEWSDPDGLFLLHDFLKSDGVELSSEDLNLLTSPEKPTFIQDEFVERIKIAEKKKKGRNIDLDVRNHCKKFHWYQNSWAYAYELNEKHFLDLIAEDVKHLKERKKEVYDIKKYLSEIKLKKRNIYKKYKMPTTASNVLYMFARMVDWRDYRKKMSVCIPVSYLLQILKRLANVNNLKLSQVAFLTLAEVFEWKIRKQELKIIKLRETGASLYACDANKNCKWLYGAKAQKIFDRLLNSLKTNTLEGYSASGGIVRGYIKIIETREDFKKMNPGDILVSTMTRPEFVPLMKIAGGVVTNEGGITCHAAILSRELGKPCVIGTQTATEILKDGDFVEVDADEGLVRKI
jgi:phosphohistidine swiveling domain-containing protein